MEGRQGVAVAACNATCHVMAATDPIAVVMATKKQSHMLTMLASPASPPPLPFTVHKSCNM